MFALGAGSLPRAPTPTASARRWFKARLERRRAQLLRARVGVRPEAFEAGILAAPPLGLLVGALVSPVIGAAALVAGLLLPRLLLSALTARRRAQSERQAPQLLLLLVTNLGAGGTYLEALQAAAAGIGDRSLAEDIREVVAQFLLDVALEEALRQVRPRLVGRNLGLVWDNLTICAAQAIPSERARDLLLDISTTVRFNVQLAGEVRAQTTGQRVQIWVLALLVPGIYLYLRLVSPYFLNVLDDTWTGRYLLLPAAAGLEVLGIYLSFRLSRVRV